MYVYIPDCIKSGWISQVKDFQGEIIRIPTSYSWENLRLSFALRRSMWSASSEIGTGGWLAMPAEQRQAKRANLRHVTAKLLLENVKSKDFQRRCCLVVCPESVEKAMGVFLFFFLKVKWPFFSPGRQKEQCACCESYWGTVTCPQSICTLLVRTKKEDDTGS